MKESQLQYVKNFLKQNGYISRNQCLQQRITRLGALICLLNKMGWKIEGKWVHKNGGRDYEYHLIDYPKIRKSVIINNIAQEIYV